MLNRSLLAVLVGVTATLANTVAAQTPGERSQPWRLYLDADMSVNSESGRAIELGFRTALDEAGWQLCGHRVELIVTDHRGSVARARRNMVRAAEDPQTLALLGGMHSPPLIVYRDWLNQQGVLTLVPWAAGTPITRAAEGDTNWIFRLSVDDSKAGRFLVERALAKGCHRALLLLDDTGWGRANQKTIRAAADELGLALDGPHWTRWGSSQRTFQSLLMRGHESGADSVIAVVNGPEGVQFLKALNQFEAKSGIVVVSHWGIAGVDLCQAIGKEALMSIDLDVLQTSYPFDKILSSEKGAAVFERASRLSGGWLEEPSDLISRNGFTHAIDLTRILVAAAQQAGEQSDPKVARAKIRTALENLKSPVQGLMRVYQQPFHPWSTKPEAIDAHEALGPADFVAARFGGDCRLHPIDAEPGAAAGK